MKIVTTTKQKSIICASLVLIIIGSFFLGRSSVQTDAQMALSQTDSFINDIKNGELSDDQTAVIVSMVAKHISVPANSKPLIATISNASDLAQQQPFYAGSQDGDLLLIYSDLQKAIIYNPKIDKLVNVGPIVIQDDQVSVDNGLVPDTIQNDTNEVDVLIESEG